MDLAARVAGLYRRLERRTREKVLQLGSVEGGGRVRGIRGVAAKKCDTTPSIAKRTAAKGLAVELPAELDGVFSCDVGDVIDKLGDRVRSLELRPLESAQTGEEISRETNAGQATGQGTAHAGVETIA